MFNFAERVVESVDEDRRVHEILKEERGDIFAWNWDGIRDKIISPGVLDVVGLEIVNYGEVGAVDFLGGNPEDFRVFRFCFGDSFVKFEVGVKFDGGVDLEFG